MGLANIPGVLASASPPRGSFFGMPPQASTIAKDVDWIFDAITWISLVFFVAIVGVMFWFMFKYRRREHVADTGGATHNTPLEVTWTVIPLILVIAIFYIGLKGYVHITTPPENAYEIQVTGQRWSWTFNYPNGAETSDLLMVPVGKPVRLTMRSDDVIHSLFIPAFRVKQDVVPGRRTMLWFEATHAGDYDLFCAEYCGTQHSQMVGRVYAFDEAEFEVKIEQEAQWFDKVPQENLIWAAAHLFNRCASCHTLDGTEKIGPSFQKTFQLYRDGETRLLTDGRTVPVDKEYLRRSILQPLVDVVDPFPSSMPPGIGKALGPRKIDALVEMITRLDEAAPGGVLIVKDRSEIMVEDE